MYFTYALRILRYLSATIDRKMTFTRNVKNFELKGFADADFGSDISDRKSRTGFIFYFNDNVISWASSLNSFP